MRERGAAIALAVALACDAAHGEETRIDPTTPPAALASAPREAGRGTTAEPLLQSILISGARRVAVISGERVQIGDALGGAVVAAIEPNEVRLMGPSGEIRLPLRRTDGKARARAREGPSQ